MEDYFKALQQISPLSDDSMTKLSQISTKKSYSKGDFVLKEGGVCKGFYFIAKGLVRIFYHKNDREISEWFAFDGEFCFSIVSYFHQTPSYLMIQCLEDCEVILLDKKGLDALRQSNVEIANLTYQMLANSLILSQERMASVQFETAIQRYSALLKLHPTMLHRVPLHYIASYLGVSAETLSRIRSQIQ